MGLAHSVPAEHSAFCGWFAVGMYVRVTIEEPRVFVKGEKVKAPLISVFKESLSSVIGITGVNGSQSTLLFVGLVYMPSYLKKQAGYATSTATTAVIAMLILATIATMFSGWLSDRIGRAKVTATGMSIGISSRFLCFGWDRFPGFMQQWL